MLSAGAERDGDGGCAAARTCVGFTAVPGSKTRRSASTGACAGRQVALGQRVLEFLNVPAAHAFRLAEALVVHRVRLPV